MRFINEHKTLLIIIICAVLVLSVPIYFGTHSGHTTAMEDTLKTTATPVQRFFKNIGDNLYDVTHSISQLRDLRNRVDELTNANNEFERRARENSDLLAENDRLKRMLELRNNNPDLDMVAATVAADEPSNWFSGFTIDKGRNSGIEKDRIVVSGDGFLIGKVVEVGNNWASVVTILDPTFSAGVMAERSRDLGIAEGDSELRTNMQFKLSYLSRAADVQEGDYVTTTGLGGIFPAGFRLGKVVSVSEDPLTMTKTAVAGVCVDMSNLRDVFVITNNLDIVADEENANMRQAREKAEQEQAEIDRAQNEKAANDAKNQDEDADSDGDETEGSNSSEDDSGDDYTQDDEDEDYNQSDEKE